MPDPVETLPAEPAVVVDPPAAPTEAERMDAVFEAATADADAQEPAPPATDADEPAPPVETVDETPPAADQPPAADPPAEAPPAAELTQEQQDEAAAKDFGFKNQRANAEFKRMRGVEREHKELVARVPELEAGADRWNQVYGFLRQHEITPERFTQTMTMTAALASKDPEMLGKARDGLLWELKQINEKLGIAGEGYDPLAQPANADLADAVRNEEMTPDRAAMVARERASAAHYRNQHQQTQDTARQAQERAQARQAGATALSAVEAEYQRIDPLFAEKQKILFKALKPTFERMDPAQWADAYKEAYQDLEIAAPAAAAPARPAPLRNQPLRTSAMPPAGAATAATSPDDIMAKAIRAAAAIDGVPSRT